MITLTGTLTAADHKSHVPLTFEVPPGTTRLSGRFTATPERAEGAIYDNLIALSIFGPDGARGARHNNPDMDFVMERTFASPGYLPGKIEPGVWTVWLDCFRIIAPSPVSYRLEVTCDTVPVMAKPAFAPQITAPRGPGWYRGDLHAHTLHSDGSWDIPDLVKWATGRGLDFMTLSDHNTTSGHAQLHSLASTSLLTLGGMEMTTHQGHALSLGGADWHEWRSGPVTGKTMPELAETVMAAGSAFVIAHPMAPGDPECTGCRWEFTDMRPGSARLVEIWNGGPWSGYNEDGLALFREWLGAGHRLRATAGSDIHGPEGGRGPVGFNHVEAEALSEAAILVAVQAGHNYLSSGPRLILTAVAPNGQIARMGDATPQGSIFHADWQSEDMPLTLIFHDATGALSRHDLQAKGIGMTELAKADGFVMAELRDRNGVLHAVTNPIFVDEAR